MVLLQFEIADDGTTNGWFSKRGSWFRLDSVWHRPVLGQLPVMSQEIFRVHVPVEPPNNAAHIIPMVTTTT